MAHLAAQQLLKLQLSIMHLNSVGIGGPPGIETTALLKLISLCVNLYTGKIECGIDIGKSVGKDPGDLIDDGCDGN